MPRRIYLASPYTSHDPRIRETRYIAACSAAALVMEQGDLVFSPIAHSHPLAKRHELPPYGQQRQYLEKIGDWDGLMRRVFANIPLADNGQLLVNLGLIRIDGHVQRYWDGWIEWMESNGWRLYDWYVWDQASGLPGYYSVFQLKISKFCLILSGMKHASEDIRKLAVHLYETGEYTQQEVADIVGYHVNSVKNWLRMAEAVTLPPKNIPLQSLCSWHRSIA